MDSCRSLETALAIVEIPSTELDLRLGYRTPIRLGYYTVKVFGTTEEAVSGAALRETAESSIYPISS